MKVFKNTYLFLAYNLSLLSFFEISFSFNLFCFIVSIFRKSKEPSKLTQKALQKYYIFWAALMSRLGVLHLSRPPVTTPSKTTGRIWVANHPSILDNSFILTFVTGANSIYKDTISSNPFYGYTAKLAGYIPNSLGPDMIREAVNSLKEGRDLVIFPEGTRSTRFDKSLVKPGFSLIAKRAEAEIRLLWMDHPDDFLTREAPIFGFPKMPALINISHFDTIQADRKASVIELTEQVSASFEKKAKEMLKIKK